MNNVEKHMSCNNMSSSQSFKSNLYYILVFFPREKSFYAVPNKTGLTKPRKFVAEIRN